MLVCKTLGFRLGHGNPLNDFVLKIDAAVDGSKRQNLLSLIFF